MHLPQPPKVLGFLIELGFHHVGQAGLELLTSGDAPAFTSQSAVLGYRLEPRCAWLDVLVLNVELLSVYFQANSGLRALNRRQIGKYIVFGSGIPWLEGK